MPKTANAYSGDQGEVVVTISAGNVSAIAAFTTAEDITIDGAVRSFKRTNDPERPFEFTKVTGDTSPILTVGDSVENETWELILVDDYFAGLTGEWGTDNLAAVAPAASVGWDPLDRPEPPVVGDYVSVSFPHPEWQRITKLEEYANNMTDITRVFLRPLPYSQL